MFRIVILIIFTLVNINVFADSVECSEYKDAGEMLREKVCFFSDTNISEAYKKTIEEKYSNFEIEKYLQKTMPLKTIKTTTGSGAEIVYVDYKVITKKKLNVQILTGIGSFNLVFNENLKGTTLCYTISPD